MNDQRKKVGHKMLYNVLMYYHLFKYPLTLYELYNYQYFDQKLLQSEKSFSLQEIKDLLDDEKMQSKISSQNGFYFLTGHDYLVGRRLKYYRYSIEKFHYALKYLRWLRFMPGVRMIAVCNSLPLQNTEDDADIDMFIVTKSQRIWTARFFVVLFLKVFGLRPTETNHKNKLCPSFFVSENNLNLEKYQHGEDIYLRNWIGQIVPCYDQGSFFEKYWEQNKWIKKYLPAIEENKLPEHLSIIDNKKVGGVKKVFEKIMFLFSENSFRNIQLKRLPQGIIDKANKKGASVVLNDAILKFHTKDRRKEYNDLFESKIKNV